MRRFLLFIVVPILMLISGAMGAFSEDKTTAESVITGHGEDLLESGKGEDLLADESTPAAKPHEDPKEDVAAAAPEKKEISEAQPESSAHEEKPTAPELQKAIPTTPPRQLLDAILVLDTSGSMYLTDPDRLRDHGANQLLQFLGKGDRLGIVSFDSKATVVRPLSDFTIDQSEATSKLISSIGTEGRYTDLTAGVKAAEKMLKDSPRQNINRAIILLSDGKMEPDPAVAAVDARTKELVETVIPELKSEEIRLYTLAFSDQADENFLKEIAIGADGMSWYSPTASGIEESFNKLFQVLNRAQLMRRSQRNIHLDDSIDEATFYIRKQPDAPDMRLITPEGRNIDPDSDVTGVKWYQGQKFDLISIREPDEGDWKLEGVGVNETFAIVLTNLKLIADWPTAVRSGDDLVIEARLYEDDKPISLPEIGGIIKFGAQITPTDKISEPIFQEFLTDDGEGGDRVKDDGVFSAKVRLSDPGEYRLNVLAKAPTFQRMQQIPFRVKQRLIDLTINTHKGEEEESHGDSHASHEGGEGSKELSQYDRHAIAEIRLSSEATALKQLEVKLNAKSPEGKKLILPLKRNPSVKGIYSFALAGLPKDGSYTLQATMKGEGKKGAEVKSDTDPITFELVPATDAPIQEVELVEEKPAAPPEEFPLFPIVFVTATNLLALIIGASLVKKLQGGNSLGIPVYAPPASLLEAISGLEQMLAATDVDINDPRFALNPEQLPPTEAAPAQEAPPAEAEPSPEASEPESQPEES